MVVLFCLDLWEIFFLPTLGFELGTSGSLVLHSDNFTTAPCQLLVFTSDNFRLFNSGAGDWWWYCSDLISEGFSFCPHWGNCGTSGCLVLHSTTTALVFMLTSGGFSPVTILRYLTLACRDNIRIGEGLWWYCSDWTCERFSFCPLLGFELGTSGCLVLHSTTAQQLLLFFTSVNFNYLTLVQRDWWWYCSDLISDRFSFCPQQGLNWGPLDL